MKRKIIKTIDNVVDNTYKIIDVICRILLAVMVFAVAYTVFARFVLGDSPSWGEESGIFFMIWIAILSIALGIRDGRHIRVSLLEFLLPKKVTIILDKFGHVIILFVALVMLIEGMRLTLLSVNVRMPAMGISSAWLYACIPVTGFAIIIMLVGKVRDGKWT